MTTEIEALRASMRAAQVFGKGQYILKGIHWLEIVKLFYKRTHMEGTTKESVICEFTVKGTNNPEMVVGETRSIVFNFEKKGWLSRFKALGLAIVGVDRRHARRRRPKRPSRTSTWHFATMQSVSASA